MKLDEVQHWGQRSHPVQLKLQKSQLVFLHAAMHLHHPYGTTRGGQFPVKKAACFTAPQMTRFLGGTSQSGGKADRSGFKPQHAIYEPCS